VLVNYTCESGGPLNNPVALCTNYGIYFLLNNLVAVSIKSHVFLSESCMYFIWHLHVFFVVATHILSSSFVCILSDSRVYFI
jgi:hypothetical protein